jgi:hypothetical protein
MYTNEESKSIRQEFWSRFENYSSLRRRQKRKQSKFIMNRTGIRQLKLKFHLDEEKALVGIDIETKNMDKRLELFEKLEQLKPILEEKIGNDLIWEIEYILPTGKSISRLYQQLNDVSIYEKDTWEKVFPFFYKNMMKIEEIFEEYRDFLKYS